MKTPCTCDWPTVAEPPCIFQAILELHRAWHDLGRALTTPLSQGLEQLLKRTTR